MTRTVNGTGHWDDLESMETGTQTYSAYSLIWRQLYNINFVMMVGMSLAEIHPG